MTIRLLRHLHHNVTKPVLRVKRDLLRTALGKPVRRDETPRAAADATSPAEAPKPTRALEASAPSRARKPTRGSATSKPKPKPAAPRDAATTQRTKAELYEEATRRGIKGRSSMTKAQLVSALAEG